MNNWMNKLVGALGLLLAIAIVSRVVWDLLQPLLPTLTIVVFLLTLFRWLLHRHRYW